MRNNGWSIFLILSIVIFGLRLSFAQKQTDLRISYSFENKSLTKVLFELSNEHNLNIYFVPSELPSFPLNGTYESVQVYKIIQGLINGTRLKVIPYQKDGIVIIDKDKLSKSYVEEIIGKWKDGTYAYPVKNETKELSYSFGLPSKAIQQNLNLAIKVFDEESKEPLVGAIITNQDLTIGENSDAAGLFKLNLQAGSYELRIDYTGYQKINLKIDLHSDASIEVPIAIQAYQFDEVEVIANSLEQKLDNAKAGLEVLSIEEISAIPQVTGEVDLMKSIEVLPGVTSTTELSQGFNIRGGSTDQNLILLNDGIIFNPTHIVGFISAFNPDVISEVNLFKGFVDSSIGGRLSGVLDVKTDLKAESKWKGKGGVGLSMLKLNLLGQINSKVSANLAARGSFNDYLLKNIANVELQNSNANFYDLNANFKVNISDQHRLHFNNYFSSDFFEFNNQFGFKWSNHHSGVQVKSNWTDGFYSTLSLNYGQYDSENFTLNTPDAFRFSAGLNYYKALLKVDKKWNNEGYFRIGIEYLNLQNEAEKLEPEGESTIASIALQRDGVINIAPFVSISTKISKKIKVEAGLRLSMLPEIEKGNFLEPRVSMNFQPSDRWTVNASYSKMSQFINQFSNTNNALPSDIWVLSNESIRPNVMDQFSIGGVHIPEEKSYEWSLGLFYKNFSQLYELNDFAQIILNENLHDDLLDADGESYGIEAQVRKRKGRWQGSIAYTFSRSFRRVVDEEFEINQGNSFPAAFDIPHQLNILAAYKWLPVASFNFAYIYRSGAPTTAPNATFIQDGFLVPLYSERNGERIGYYSRLDFSIILDLRKSRKQGFRNSFSLGFYNVLGRNNPTSVFFRRSKLGNIVPFQFSVVGALVPNFSWNFVF